MAAQTIWVQAASKLKPGRVALYERNEDHPVDKASGERRAWVVAGRPPVRVAMTQAVADKIRTKDLVQVESPKGGKKSAPEPVEPEEPEAPEDTEPEARTLGTGGAMSSQSD